VLDSHAQKDSNSKEMTASEPSVKMDSKREETVASRLSAKLTPPSRTESARLRPAQLDTLKTELFASLLKNVQRDSPSAMVNAYLRLAKKDTTRLMVNVSSQDAQPDSLN
jgi:hypothetical protein